MAEGIGEALAHLVNRLEALDTEREKAYDQLVALQERLNLQVVSFSKAFGKRLADTATAGRRAGGRRAKQKSSKKGARQKGRVKCSVCGTLGHNARGHAKWKKAQAK